MKQKSSTIDGQFNSNGGFVFMVIFCLIKEFMFNRVHIH